MRLSFYLQIVLQTTSSSSITLMELGSRSRNGDLPQLMPPIHASETGENFWNLVHSLRASVGWYISGLLPYQNRVLSYSEENFLHTVFHGRDTTLNAFRGKVGLTTRTTCHCFRGLVEGGGRFIAKNLVGTEKGCIFANGRKYLATGLSAFIYIWYSHSLT